jgi:predicted SnoaL-like aldol condensation-catalyzing enzyme
MSEMVQEQNKALVLDAFDTLFNKRNYAATEKFWSPRQRAHWTGREGLFNLVENAPSTLKYEPRLVVAGWRLCNRHGRFSGMGQPVNWIVADILRIENGLLAKHWDVIQDKASRETSKSGLPMFGNKFPE